VFKSGPCVSTASSTSTPGAHAGWLSSTGTYGAGIESRGCRWFGPSW